MRGSNEAFLYIYIFQRNCCFSPHNIKIMTPNLREKAPKAPKAPKAERIYAKVVRREGPYHLYRCMVCLTAKHPEGATPAEIKANSYSNVMRHHWAHHPNQPFQAMKGDAYYQSGVPELKVLKKFAKTFVEPKDYFPPPPFYVEPNPEPI